jgi:hypothetical protein
VPQLAAILAERGLDRVPDVDPGVVVFGQAGDGLQRGCHGLVGARLTMGTGPTLPCSATLPVGDGNPASGDDRGLGLLDEPPGLGFVDLGQLVAGW